MNTLIRSTEGYAIPEAGERAIYWPHMDYTNIYSANDFAPSLLRLEDGGIINGAEIICPR